MRDLMMETGWLRRLAVSLVKDPAVAEDVVQDAWIVASRKAPTDGRPLRPWLARVVLNLVRMRSRADKRRAVREARSSEVAAGASTPAQLYERVEMQRMLADAILALAPIYRDVVLLHYVDGLTSIEIGGRLGVSEGTVRWRLSSAIQQMRAMLDEKKKGNRALWLAPMVRLAYPDAAASGTGFAAAIVFAAILVGGIALFLGTRGSSSPASAHEEPANAQRRAAIAMHDSSSAPQPASIPPWAAQEGASAKRIAGVVRSRGAALPAAHVVLHMINHPEDPVASATTGPDGAFDFGVLPAVDYIVGASSPGLTPAVLTVALADPAPRVPQDKLVLELDSCEARVYGTISDASGGPIAHATVKLDKIIGTESDSRGHYDLCVRTMPNWIVVGADGYALTAVLLRWLGGAVEHDITLVPEGTIIGKVVTVDGAPVPGARVEAGPMLTMEAQGQTVIADADGMFQVPQLASAQYRLHVDAPGLLGFSEPIDVRAGTTTPLQTIVVGAAATVHARVLVGAKPAAGAHVFLQNQNQQHIAAAYVQGDGSIVFANVPLGPARLEAESYRVISPERVDITASTKALEITLAPQASIAGRLLRNGAPVADGVVACQPLTRDIKASSDGSFVIEGLNAPECKLYGYSLATGSTSGMTTVALPAGQRQTVDLDLVNDASIEGEIVDEHGAPVAGVEVRFIGDTDGGAAVTDERGQYRVMSLIGGMELRPLVLPSPFDSSAFEWAEPQPVVRLADGHSHVTGVRLAIKHVRESIRGRVVDDRQQPVADATVSSWGPHDTNDNTTHMTRTRADGRFELADLAPGAFRVQVQGADSSIAMQQGVAAGSEITLVLPRSGRIEGTLVGFSSSPYVVALDHERGLGVGTFVTADHRFRTLGLTPGTYLLTVNGGGSAIERVEVRAGEVTHVELVSKGTARVEVTLVRHGDRTPIADAPCVATASAYGYPAWWNDTPARTDAAGKTVITDAPAGHVRVQCFPQGASQAASEIDVPANGSGAVTVVSVAAKLEQVDAGFDVQPFEMPTRVWHVRGPHAAALAVGDVILAIDGEDIRALAPTAVVALIQSHAAGSQLVVKLQRGDAVRTATIVVRRMTDQ